MRDKIKTTSARFLAFLPTKAALHSLQVDQTKVERKDNAYLVECEALRGIAILLVVLFHCSLTIQKSTPISPNLLNSFMLSGNTGVTLFFVLSGFLLNLPFMAGKPIRPRNFYTKRALRILPMYSCAVIIGAIYRHQILTGLKSLVFFDIQLTTLFPFGAVWWSLVTEVQFYLLLPCLHFLWRSTRWRWLLLPILLIACYFYFSISRSSPDSYYAVNGYRDTILALWPTFLLGALLAAIHAQYGAKIKNYFHASKLFRSGLADLTLGILIFVLAELLFKVAMLTNYFAYVTFFDHVVLEAFLWTLIIAAILYLPAHMKLIFTHPAIVFFGLISYSLYLLHFPTMFLGLFYLRKFTNMLTTFSLIELQAMLVAAAVVISALTYQLIEKPTLGLKKKLAP